MAEIQLNYSNRQRNCLVFDDFVMTQLHKSSALLSVLLSHDLVQCKPSVIHDYLWVLSDIIEQTMAYLIVSEKTNKIEVTQVS